MQKICEFCNGSGQTSFFKGVSRFLLSVEDCPECAGLGFIDSSDSSDEFDEKKKSKQHNSSTESR